MAGKFNLAEHIQVVQPPATRDIEVITREILDAKHQAGESILTIGRVPKAIMLLSSAPTLTATISTIISSGTPSA